MPISIGFFLTGLIFLVVSVVMAAFTADMPKDMELRSKMYAAGWAVFGFAIVMFLSATWTAVIGR